LFYLITEGIAEPPQRSTPALLTKTPSTTESFTDTRGYVTGYCGHIPGAQVLSHYLKQNKTKNKKQKTKNKKQKTKNKKQKTKNKKQNKTKQIQ
jgi:uncharacterized transporter YbjL